MNPMLAAVHDAQFAFIFISKRFYRKKWNNRTGILPIKISTVLLIIYIYNGNEKILSLYVFRYRIIRVHRIFAYQ